MPDSNTSRVNDMPLSPDPIQRAFDYGIDISLLEVNLSKTLKERAEDHDARMNEILDIQRRFAGNQVM